jgi:hypothetical protein
MSAPELSVVVASVNGFPYLADCLDALEERCPQAEIVVADSTDEETRRTIRERWPRARLVSFDEPKTVPELRAAGIAAAKAQYVAVLEDHCVPVDGWANRILERHREGRAVVGGSIRNGADERLRDWAAFLCEYGKYMEPTREGPASSLVGVNVSYDRRALAEIADLLREGRWETWLHERLRGRGVELWSEPAMVVDHIKDFGVREFLSQRYHYSRSYAGMRNADLGWKRALYLVGSPALIPLAYYRIAREVLSRRRHRGRLLLATPLILVYTTVWAFGEAVGYAFGGGRSLLQVR